MANMPQGLGHWAASAPRLIQEVISPHPTTQTTDGRELHFSGANSHLPAEAEHEQLLYRLVLHCSVQTATKEDPYRSSGVHSR